MEEAGTDDTAEDDVDGDFVDIIFLHAFAFRFTGRQPDTNADGRHQDQTVPAQNKGTNVSDDRIKCDGKHSYQTSIKSQFQTFIILCFPGPNPKRRLSHLCVSFFAYRESNDPGDTRV